ncbi:unnamed protein product [Staurois parvus]|uniref:Uncharacterized protein n=1 Tax=Staurois parvus TaxID=386267 RepID=A0ABN9C0V8_9NEOB|nr:unnamed protein product [Staurois parvus]
MGETYSCFACGKCLSCKSYFYIYQ